jgi:outer membrane protein TolC
MNDSTGDVLIPTDSLRLDKPTEKIANNLSEERADLKAMSLATDAYESLYKADKLSFAPSLNAFGSYQMYDDDIFQFGANGYIFGAALKWNILEGTRRFGKTDKSRATYEKSRLEYEQYTDQSQLELNKTLRLLSDTEVQLELSELAMNQSDEALRIRTSRYKEGLEKTTDLLIAETQYAQRQLEYYQTVFNYNRTRAYLKYLTTTR